MKIYIMAKREILKKASKKKNDEFFTLYNDVANEVSLYKDQLKGKRILCPCDWDESYEEEIVYQDQEYIKPSKPTNFSTGGVVKKVDIKATKVNIEKNINLIKCNFIKYLVAHANAYQIKSISVSGYNPEEEKGVKFQDIDYSDYDIVITNPPFSLFREFIDTMFKNKMQFLVVGPLTALTYRDTFLHIKNNEMWLGYAKQLSGFMLPDGTLLFSKNPEGSVPRACKWYTNMDASYRYDMMILTEKYDPEKNPKYYNYDAVEVSKTLKIPYDYEGLMGVPVTFLSKYNPEQFEVIGKGVDLEKTVRWRGDKSSLWIEKDGQPWKEPFERIVIRNKHVVKDEE